MDGPLSIWEVLLRLLLASLSGAALGFEREAKDKPAGLKTYMLVSLGACAFVVGSLQTALTNDVDDFRFDMSRVVQGIIGGVGFLGAGAIIQSRRRVKGVTTAAGIWIVAAIGTACGFGLYVLSCSTVLFALVILTGVGFVEDRLFPGTTPEQEDPSQPSKEDE